MTTAPAPSPLAPTTLLTVGAEGGKLDVLGRLVDGAWRFRLALDQRTFASFDPSLEGMPLYEESEWTEDWQEILDALDRDGCWNLYATWVHPELAARIEQALAERDVDTGALNQWRYAIARGRQPAPAPPPRPRRPRSPRPRKP